MTYGEAARQVFGPDVVDKFASILANDALRHIVSSDYLAASFSAAHAIRLSGPSPWTVSDQEQMATALGDNVRSSLKSDRPEIAASRAANYRMLTGSTPWSDEEISRMREPATKYGAGNQSFRSLAVAEEIASYLVLGGAVFWSEADFREMRAALILSFKEALDHGREVHAADRLATFDILEGALEAPSRT